MKDEIEQYTPREPSIVAIGERRIRAFVGDQTARLDGVLWVGDTPTRIVTLAGGRRVEAIAFDTRSMNVGDAVRCDAQTANWPSPRAGRTPLEGLAFEPGPARETPRPESSPAVVQTGIGALDGLFPLITGGVTLLLDAGAPDRCTDQLASHLGGTIAGAAARDLPHATHQILGASGLALRIAAEWAATLQCALQLEAEPFDIDALLDGRVGTTLVRVHLRDGLEILAETLELGHSDTQLMLLEDGRIDLTRSASRLCPNPTLAAELGGLDAAREQEAIFGMDDVGEAHRVLLERARHLEDDLL